MIKYLVVVLVIVSSCAKVKKEKKEKKNKPNTPVFVEYPKAKDVKLNFLDEFVYPSKQNLEGTEIGGLSGIDYANGKYYIVCDDSYRARYYKADIKIENKKITDVLFNDMVYLAENNYNFFKTHSDLDLESIISVDEELLFSSEGNISKGVNPIIIGIGKNSFSQVALKERFLVTSNQKPRHNGGFEGLSKSFDNKGFWTALELPLVLDGEESKFAKTNSPIRFMYYDENQKATKEFVYELSALSRKPKGKLNISGQTDILEYKKNHFLVIERSYQKDYINDTNVVKIYKAVIDDTTTNVIDQNILKEYVPMKKELVLDMHSIKSQFKSKIIDNIEGITFGSKLANGNQSLLLISDDNFQKYGKQINQFLLFEFVYDK